MTKVMVLGAAGMLGHKLYQVLGDGCDITGTIRGGYAEIGHYGIFDEAKIIGGVDALKMETVAVAVSGVKPDVVVNAVGIVKSLEQSAGRQMNIAVNALFPHRLYELCREHGARLIHISTDCVFSGATGNYREDDVSDAGDDYGRTKYLGEVDGEGALTLRTSFIGRELGGASGLVEWFLSNRGGRINGFTNAVFSGFPSVYLAGIIGDIISRQPGLTGIYHVASRPLSKYDLLVKIRNEMGLDIRIDEFSDFRCDRSLDASLFNEKTGFQPPSWDKMVTGFAADAADYAKWRTE
jgi:dTDP-4-dehydrorhamnose reductase